MTHSFWCEKCQKDFDAPGYKSSNRYGEWWVGRDPKGHKAIRHITERLKDPYFWKSRKLREQRVEFRKDLLQPGQKGYDMAYPEMRMQFDQQTQVDEIKTAQTKDYYGRLYKEAGMDHSKREAIKAAEKVEHDT